MILTVLSQARSQTLHLITSSGAFDIYTHMIGTFFTYALDPFYIACFSGVLTTKVKNWYNYLIQLSKWGIQSREHALPSNRFAFINHQDFIDKSPSYPPKTKHRINRSSLRKHYPDQARPAANIKLPHVGHASSVSRVICIQAACNKPSTCRGCACIPCSGASIKKSLAFHKAACITSALSRLHPHIRQGRHRVIYPFPEGPLPRHLAYRLCLLVGQDLVSRRWWLSGCRC